MEALPIPNKTILQDSKVLGVVEKWSLAPSSSTWIVKKVKTEVSEATSSDSVTPTAPVKAVADNSTDSPPIVVSFDELPTPVMESPMELSIKEEDVKMDTTTDPVSVIEPVVPEAEEGILGDTFWYFVDVSKDLLGSWSGLQEVFRIPKRERVEQLKEHEREADKVEPYLLHDLSRTSTYDRDG